MAISMQDVENAIRHAINEYDSEYMGQSWLKAVSVLIVDHLISALRTPVNHQPFMCVNSMNNDWAQHIRNNVLQNCSLYDYECLLDINLMQGAQDPYHILLTAESEGFAAHAANLPGNDQDLQDKDLTDNDMMWDLYKLLVVPSPVRFFVTLASSIHHANLQRCTDYMVQCYSAAGFLRPEDDMWAIQFPTASMDNQTVLVTHWPPGLNRQFVQSEVWARP